MLVFLQKEWRHIKQVSPHTLQSSTKVSSVLRVNRRLFRPVLNCPSLTDGKRRWIKCVLQIPKAAAYKLLWLSCDLVLETSLSCSSAKWRFNDQNGWLLGNRHCWSSLDSTLVHSRTDATLKKYLLRYSEPVRHWLLVIRRLSEQVSKV